MYQLPHKRLASVTSLPSQPLPPKTERKTSEQVPSPKSLLRLIVACSLDKITYAIPELLDPKSEKQVKDAQQKKKYRAVRRLLRKSYNNQSNKACSASPPYLPQGAAAMTDSWQVDYREQSKSYARYADLVQSLSTGKSRMNGELAKKILHIPINLSGSVITQDQEKSFAELLDLSRITRRAFLMDPALDPEVEALGVRERLRRMAPGMSGEKEHFEGYTDIKGA
ncbi:unnamed protein product [Cyclocybe aegerita]|uniref:Uncharacterized protein n=1 Tax=Cyclocybe aegerita TaxID=1973307 RepID=A0A8S0WTF3_CYCAE|nr:unnamed protein product [Cyclocybe aegerita]